MAISRSRNASIAINYLDARRPPGFVIDDSWPRQDTPSKAQCRLWKRYIRSSFLRYVPYWISNPLAGTVQQADPESQTPTEDGQNNVTSIPKQHQRLLDGFQQLATDDQIWKAFRSRRRLHIATDGGLFSQQGTHGWVISTGSRILMQCAGPVDGPLVDT